MSAEPTEDPPELPPFPKEGVTLLCLQRIRDCVLKIDPTWTTTDVCNNLIKPITEAKQGAFVDLFEKHTDQVPVFALATAPGNGAQQSSDAGKIVQVFAETFNLGYNQSFGVSADVFVSHAWRYCFVELVEALETFFIDQAKSCSSSSIVASNSGDIKQLTPVNTLLWFDLVVNNQWKACDLPFEWWSGTFRSAVGEIGHTCLVLLPWETPIPLTRSWCLWEILSTIVTNTKLTIQFSQTQQASFQQKIRKDYISIMTAFCQLDVEKSEAWNPLDKERIFEAVRKSDGGFAGVNKIIMGLLRRWMRDTVASLLVLKSKRSSQIIPATNPDTAEPAPEDDVLTKEEYEEYLEDMGCVARFEYDHGHNDSALKLYQLAIDTYSPSLGADHPAIASCLHNKAVILMGTDRWDEAALIFENVYKVRIGVLGEFHEETIGCKVSLSSAYLKLGRFSDAECLLNEIKDIDEVNLPLNSPYRLSALMSLASALQQRGALESASAMLRTVVSGREALFGAEHPDTLEAYSSLATNYYFAGNIPESLDMYRKAAACGGKTLGSEHPMVLSLTNNLCTILTQSKLYDEAEALLHRTLGTKERVLGKSHDSTLQTMCNLSNLLSEMGDARGALDVANRVYKERLSKHGELHHETLNSQYNVATLMYALCEDANDNDNTMSECLDLFRSVSSHRTRVLGPNHPDTISSKTNFAFVLGQRIANLDEGIEIAKEVVAAKESLLGIIHEKTMQSVTTVVKMLACAGRLQEARLLLAEKLASFYAAVNETSSCNASGAVDELCNLRGALGKCEEFHQSVAQNIDTSNSTSSSNYSTARGSSVDSTSLARHHEGHEHELNLFHYLYDGSYSCDECGKYGVGWVYACRPCGYDIHPQCLVKKKEKSWRVDMTHDGRRFPLLVRLSDMI